MNPIVFSGSLPAGYYPMPELGYQRVAIITASITTTPAVFGVSPETHTLNWSVSYQTLTHATTELLALTTGASTTGVTQHVGLGERLGPTYPYVARARLGYGRNTVSLTGDADTWQFYIPVYDDESVTEVNRVVGNESDPHEPNMHLAVTVSGNVDLGTTYVSMSGTRTTSGLARLSDVEVDTYRYPYVNTTRAWDSIAFSAISGVTVSVPAVNPAFVQVQQTESTINGSAVTNGNLELISGTTRQIPGTATYELIERLPLGLNPIYESGAVVGAAHVLGLTYSLGAEPGYIRPRDITEFGPTIGTSIPDTFSGVLATPPELFTTIQLQVPAKAGDEVWVEGNRIVVRDALNPNQGEHYVWSIGGATGVLDFPDGGYMEGALTAQIEGPGVPEGTFLNVLGVYNPLASYTPYERPVQIFRTTALAFLGGEGTQWSAETFTPALRTITAVNPDVASDAPIADFTDPPLIQFTPTSSKLTVTVTDTSVPTSATSTWNWGDGTVTTGLTSTHTYSESDCYTVTLTTDQGVSVQTVCVEGGQAPVTPLPGIDLPMEQLTAEQYGQIAVKYTTATFPLKFYDDEGYPSRTLTFWPIPKENYLAMLWLWQPLVSVEDLDTDIVFPNGYERALRFALANELAAEFGKEVPQGVKRIAALSKGNIKRLNSVPQIMRGSLEIASNRQKLFNYIIGDTIGSTGIL